MTRVLRMRTNNSFFATIAVYPVSNEDNDSENIDNAIYGRNDVSNKIIIKILVMTIILIKTTNIKRKGWRC